MKTTFLLAVALAALFLTAGCETGGLSRREQATISYPGYILNLRPETPPAGPAKLTVPLRLAVVQVGEPAPPRAMLDYLQSERPLVAAAVGLPSWMETRGQSNNTEIVFEQVQAVCRLARSVDADHVFIFGGNMGSWSEANSLRFFDLTLVAGTFVPSTKVLAEGKAAGALINTTTCQPNLLVSVDATRSIHSPSQLVSGKADTLRAALRDELTDKLADELLRTLAARQELAVARPAGGDPADADNR